MRVFVAGHRGLVGSAVCRRLAADGHEIVISYEDLSTSHPGIIVRLASGGPATGIDAVVMAAARVGGIGENIASPRRMLRENLAIQRKLFDFAWSRDIEKLIFLGSTCLYPRERDVMISESELMTGPLEPTNQSYALAKLIGLEEVRLARMDGLAGWTALMPSNLYGPGDNFNLERAHACAAILRKVQLLMEASDSAPLLELWGVPWTQREWLYVDDLADAIVTVLYSSKNPTQDFYNVGSGEVTRMDWLANRIQSVAGTNFAVAFDSTKPIGAIARSLDSRAFRTEFDWYSKTQLDEGLRKTWEWMQANRGAMRR